jgi:peptidoglycan/LPS O-acetylase OafA/YrhL
MTNEKKKKIGVDLIITGFVLIIAAVITVLLAPPQYMGTVILVGILGVILILVGCVLVLGNGT